MCVGACVGMVAKSKSDTVWRKKTANQAYFIQVQMFDGGGRGGSSDTCESFQAREGKEEKKRHKE